MAKPFIYCIVLLHLLCPFYAVNSQGKGGRWEFENNGDDTAAWDFSDDNGILQNQAGFGSFPPLQQGNAYLWLDSSNVHDFFKIEDSDDLDFDNEDIGISAWIYPLVLNDVHYLVNKGIQDATPKTTNYAIRISLDKKLEFLIRDANNQAQRVTSSFNIAENQWRFVAVFYDYPGGKVYMWNNPAAPPVDILNFTRDFFSNDDPLSIGSWARNDPANPSIKDFQGRMDDVRISGRMEDIVPGYTVIVPGLQEISRQYRLHQNYPNPFNPATTITFEIPGPARVSLNVYNPTGALVKTLVDEFLPAGLHQARFESPYPVSGFYFYRLKTTDFSQTRKMLLMK